MIDEDDMRRMGAPITAMFYPRVVVRESSNAKAEEVRRAMTSELAAALRLPSETDWRTLLAKAASLANNGPHAIRLHTTPTPEVCRRCGNAPGDGDYIDSDSLCEICYAAERG